MLTGAPDCQGSLPIRLLPRSMRETSVRPCPWKLDLKPYLSRPPGPGYLLAGMLMMIDARAPERTVLDLSPMVSSQRASKATPTRLRPRNRECRAYLRALSDVHGRWPRSSSTQQISGPTPGRIVAHRSRCRRAASKPATWPGGRFPAKRPDPSVPDQIRIRLFSSGVVTQWSRKPKWPVDFTSRAASRKLVIAAR